MNVHFILCTCAILILLIESTREDDTNQTENECSKCKKNKTRLTLGGCLKRIYELAKQWLEKLKKNVQLAIKWLSEKLRLCLDRLMASRKQVYEVKKVDTANGSYENLSAISFVTKDKEKAKLIAFWKFPQNEQEKTEPLFTLEARKIRMEEYRSSEVHLTYDGSTKYDIVFKNARHAERFRNFLPYKSKAHLS